jgi:glycosyltransferase involved in cell wall biosynthesis
VVEGDAHQQIGYILRSYPRLSQTFILNEILALERLGLSIQLYALENPHEALVQAQVAEVRARVRYLDEALRLGWAKTAQENLQVLWSSPLRYIRTALYVLKGSGLDAGYRTATRLECFRMAVHLVSILLRGSRGGGMRSSASRTTATASAGKSAGISEFQTADASPHKPGGVVHLHAHFAHDPALVALLASRLTGIPFSFTAHARDLYQLAAPALIERVNGASVIVTCCAANQDYLARVLPEPLDAKIRLIHHGADVEAFTPPALEVSGPIIPVILSVGRLVEKKGFPDLLEAFGLLKQAGHDFCGMIYGDGPLREKLAARIGQLGLEGFVRLAGETRQQDLVPIYQTASIFALTPSISADGDRDGIPNVLVEAMACGLPVVSTAVAGIPELVVDGQNGLLSQPHDVQGIAASLAELLSDENLRNRLGAAARQTVEASFNLDAGARQMAAILLRQFSSV